MMAQSTLSKYGDFESKISYNYIKIIDNYPSQALNFYDEPPLEFLYSKIKNEHEECTLVLMLYPAGYDAESDSHVAFHAYINKNIPYKIVVDVAVCDQLYKECFKRRVILTKAYQHDGLVKDFVSKSDLTNNLEFLGYSNELHISCQVVVVYEESEERKLVPAILRRLHFDNYEKLFDNEEYSDFEIKVGDTTFKVHKCILAIHSSVFAAMFRHDMSEKNHSSTDIPDVDVDVMREFLRFIYTGKVEKLDELAAELWVVADKYNVDMLKKISEGKLIEKLNVDTITETLCLLDQFKISKLKDAAIACIINNAEKVKKNEQFENTFRKLSSDLLTDVLYAVLGNPKISS